MTSSIVIRSGLADDAAFLAGYAARLFQETFGPDNRPADMAVFLANTFTETRQREELTDPRVTTLFADIDGAIAGYAQVRACRPPDGVTGPDPIELARFYVDRPWQGRGVAQALMAAVEAEARTRGARTLWLGVWERNHRAQAFYRKFGFVPVGSHIFLLGSDEQTDLLMSRPV